MAPRTTAKPKRHKKRKSRTEVSSDISSDSEVETTKIKSPSPAPAPAPASESAQARKQLSPSSSETSTSPEPPSKDLTDKQIEVAFTKYYLTRATAEFADDLEKLRTSEGFKDEAVPMLISALHGGTSMFSPEEKRRVVLAERDVK